MTDYILAPKSIVDELAQFIRQVDGNHKLGAGALAEKICERFRVGAPTVQGVPVEGLRYTFDGALAECPYCGSLDVGGAHDTVHCQSCGLTVTKPGPLQNAMDAWNTNAIDAWNTRFGRAHSAAPAVQGEPVSAEVRYRRPEKSEPDWSVWQPAEVRLDRPSWEIDSQGWEVEYRLLYTAPQPAKQQPAKQQPAPDVEALDTAELYTLLMILRNSIGGTGLTLDGEVKELAVRTENAISAVVALAAHRKQGGES